MGAAFRSLASDSQYLCTGSTPLGRFYMYRWVSREGGPLFACDDGPLSEKSGLA